VRCTRDPGQLPVPDRAGELLCVVHADSVVVADDDEGRCLDPLYVRSPVKGLIHRARTFSQTSGKWSGPSGEARAYMAANITMSPSSGASDTSSSIAPGTYPALEKPDPVTVNVRTSPGCSAATRVPTMPPSLHPSRSTGPNAGPHRVRGSDSCPSCHPRQSRVALRGLSPSLRVLSPWR